MQSAVYNAINANYELGTLATLYQTFGEKRMRFGGDGAAVHEGRRPARLARPREAQRPPAPRCSRARRHIAAQRSPRLA